MKTYILNSINRLKSFSQKLDAESTLYSKSWEVFNDTGNKELFIFRPNNELLISRNGIAQRGKWDLLDVANIIIDVGEKTFLLNAAYIEEKFLALKLDGTNEYMVMIETDMKDRFSLNTIGSIEKYLEDRYKNIEQKRIEKVRAEQKRIEAVREADKKQKERDQRERETRQKRIEEEEAKRIEYLKGAPKRYYSNTIRFIISLFITVITVPGLFLLDDNDSISTITTAVLSLLWCGFLFLTIILYSDFMYFKKEYEEYEYYKERGKYK